jgi:hypothetical protein
VERCTRASKNKGFTCIVEKVFFKPPQVTSDCPLSDQALPIAGKKLERNWIWGQGVLILEQHRGKLWVWVKWIFSPKEQMGAPHRSLGAETPWLVIL